MFVPFKIETRVIDQIIGDKSYPYDTDYIKARLKANINLETIKQKLIDGTRLQEEWFPSEFFDSQFDVFISHAHKDETKVKKLAGYLFEEYGLKSFIDSCYWSYANDLQLELDKWYSKNNRDGESKLFDYNTSNFMAANVHIMLSMALMKMMDACECLIFVDTDNSLKYAKGQIGTPSPWIYEEIGFSRRLRVNIPDRYKDRVQVRICESRNTSHIALECFSADSKKPEFNYNVDMRSFKPLLPSDFITKPEGISTAILDRWYRKYGIYNAIKNKL